jgi:hypothetical protein
MNFNETYGMKDECVLEKLSQHTQTDVARLEFQPRLQPEIVSRDVYFRTEKSNSDAPGMQHQKRESSNSFLTYYILDE